MSKKSLWPFARSLLHRTVSAKVLHILHFWWQTWPLSHAYGGSLPALIVKVSLMVIRPCFIVIVEEQKANLMSLAILFHFLCAQHVSDINISIIRSCAVELPHRSFCSRFVVCWRFGAAGFEWCPYCRLKPAIRTPLKPSRTKSPTHNEPRTKRPMW